MAKDVSNNLVGVAGEYFMCAELCRVAFGHAHAKT